MLRVQVRFYLLLTLKTLNEDVKEEVFASDVDVIHLDLFAVLKIKVMSKTQRNNCH